MLCPHCGSEIADDSRTCPKCRALLSSSSQPLAATDVSRDTPRQEQQVRQVALTVFAAAVAVAVAVFAWIQSSRHAPSEFRKPGSMVSKPIVISSVSIKPNDYSSYQFAISDRCLSPRVTGRWEFAASTGSSSGTVSVMRDADFLNWKDHRPATSLYSQRLSSGEMDVVLPSAGARYFLVFNNPGIRAQQLTATISQRCGVDK